MEICRSHIVIACSQGGRVAPQVHGARLRVVGGQVDLVVALCIGVGVSKNLPTQSLGSASVLFITREVLNMMI